MPLPRDWFEQLDNAVNKVIADREQRSSKTVVDRGTTFCRECGMHITSESEYHPFAACLMFKACGDPDAVTANLMAVVQHGQEQQRNRRATVEPSEDRAELIRRLENISSYDESDAWDVICDAIKKLRRPEPPSDLLNAVGIAYGWLWHVNNMPEVPTGVTPDQASYKARHALRDLLSHEQRGEYINRVAMLIRESETKTGDRNE